MAISILTIVENAAEKALNSGRMIAFYVPIPAAEYIQSLFADVPGDEVKPRQMHITLGLIRDGDNSNIIKTLKNITPQINKFPVEINEFGIFPPTESSENKIVLHAKPKCDAIFDIHEKVFNELKGNGIAIDNGSFDFNPHITIKYCENEPDINIPIKQKFILDKIFLAQGKKRKGFDLA